MKNLCLILLLSAVVAPYVDNPYAATETYAEQRRMDQVLQQSERENRERDRLNDQWNRHEEDYYQRRETEGVQQELDRCRAVGGC